MRLAPFLLVGLVACSSVESQRRDAKLFRTVIDEEQKGFEELGSGDDALERIKTYSEKEFSKWQASRLNSAMERYQTATIAAGLMEDKTLSRMVQVDIQLTVTDAFLDVHSWTAIKRQLIDQKGLLEFHDNQKRSVSESSKRSEMLMAYMEIKANGGDPRNAQTLFESHAKRSRTIRDDTYMLLSHLGLEIDLCVERGSDGSHIQEPHCQKCGGFGAYFVEK